MAITKADITKAIKREHKKLMISLSKFLEEKLAPLPRLEKDVGVLKKDVGVLKKNVGVLK